MDKKQILENITTEENKCNLIFEAGGIGFSDYLSEINTIAAYVSAYIATFPPSKDNKWKIKIPKQYTEKIDKFKDLSINVEVEDVGTQLNIYGSGDSKLNPFPMVAIQNGKIIGPEDINIKYYSNGNKFYVKTFISILIHELNHKAEELGRENRTELNPMQINAQVANSLDNIELSNNKELNQYIRDIFYALFDSSELNAFTASVYGDLEGMKSIRKNFSKDIKRTMAYYWYKSLNDRLPLIINNKEKNFWMLLETIIEASAIQYKGHYKTIGEFRTWFINRAVLLLKKYYKKMLNTAGYYYAKQEDQISGGYQIPTRKK